VVREEVGAGGEMTQALYAHMTNKKIKVKINK
jgi:NaMN:DMB phosphoribosyltransferase